MMMTMMIMMIIIKKNNNYNNYKRVPRTLCLAPLLVVVSIHRYSANT